MSNNQLVSDCSHVNIATSVAAPFIHKFETDKKKYLFDVNTSRILRVDDLMWKIVNDFGKLSLGRITIKNKDEHLPRGIARAWERIASSQDNEGLLLAKYPKQIPVPYNYKQLNKMLSSERMQLILNVTEACNFRCSYCVYGQQGAYRRGHSGRNMIWDVARRAIDEFLESCRDSKTKVISFYGGEPLLNIQLIRDCVSYVRNEKGRSDIQFAMTTNASLLKDEIGDFLAANQFGVVVSLDGPRTVHDRYRRYSDDRPTWSDVTGNLHIFLENHPEYKTNNKLTFTSVISPPTTFQELQEFFKECNLFLASMNFNASIVNMHENPEQQRRIFEEIKECGLSELYDDFLADLMGGAFEKIRNTPAGWLKTSLFEKPFLVFHKRKYFTTSLPERFCSLSTCIPGIRRLFVSIDGNYYPCERTPESDFMKIGSVNIGLSTSKVAMLLEKWITATNTECRYCWCLPVCDVGCFANVNENGKISMESKQKACGEFRQRMHKTLCDYCHVLENNPNAFDYMAKITLT